MTGKKKELLTMTALELGRAIKRGETTAPEAVQAALDQADALEPRLGAYLTIDRERAMERAGKVQDLIESGALTGPLAGVPAALKDNLCTSGLRTTCASRMLEHFIPAYSATAVERLEKAGAVILGKTNMDEFAMGSTTETSAFQETANPWDTGRSPGGSSGGSCAAATARECFFALGSDTGGSIRQPASHCGITGLKPTYGAVSRYGLVAYGSSLDQIGPVALDVADCAAVLETIIGRDEKDSTSCTVKDGNFASSLTGEAKELRVGIPSDYLREGADREVRETVLEAGRALKDRGARVEEFHMGLVKYAVPAYYVIACAEASSNLSRFDGVKYGFRSLGYEGLQDMYKKTRSQGFGPEVKRRIMLGAFALSSGYYDAYYLKALRVKSLIVEALDSALQSYDVILGPVAPSAAPLLGESLKDPMKMYLSDIYTVPANLAGLPAMTVPFGMDSSGLPIGVQLTGGRFREKDLIRAGSALETGKKRVFPPIANLRPDAAKARGERVGYDGETV